MKELVSIIIPVYNCESYLIECVNSVLMQDYEQFEIILIDDGSTDSSGLICDEFAKNHSKIHVYHNENKGVSFSRNYGIEKSLGEYIIFIDSDDYVDKTFVKKMISVLSPEIDISFCRFNTFSNDCKKRYYESTLKRLVEMPQNFSLLLIDENYKSDDSTVETDCVFGSVCRSAFKKEIIVNNSLAFNTDIVLGEDLLFILNYLTRVKKAILIDEYLYFYRKNQNSAVSTNAKGYVESFVQINYPLLQEKIKIIKSNCPNSNLIDYLNMKFIYAFAVNELKLQKHQKTEKLTKFYKNNSKVTFSIFKVCSLHKFSLRQIILFFLLKHKMWNIIKILLR